MLAISREDLLSSREHRDSSDSPKGNKKFNCFHYRWEVDFMTYELRENSRSDAAKGKHNYIFCSLSTTALRPLTAFSREPRYGAISFDDLVQILIDKTCNCNYFIFSQIATLVVRPLLSSKTSLLP